MNMAVDQTVPAAPSAPSAAVAGSDGRNTEFTEDSRNSREGGQYFEKLPDGSTRIRVSTEDRIEGSPNGNRAELNNTSFSSNEANDFEAWFTVNEGHSFSVAQMLNNGTDGKSPDVMFTVEEGNGGQRMLRVQGRGVKMPQDIGPLPPDGHFGIKISYDGAGGFTAQVYTGSEAAPVPYGPAISGTITTPDTTLQFRTGVYFDGYNGKPYPKGMKINADVTVQGPSTAFQTTAELPTQPAPAGNSGGSL